MALAFYVSLLVVIGLAAWRGLNTDTKLGRLLIALWWVIVAAGVGGPVFTANRALVPLWVVMIVAFSCVAKEYPGNLLPRPRRDQNRSAVGQVSRGEEVA